MLISISSTQQHIIKDVSLERIQTSTTAVISLAKNCKVGPLGMELRYCSDTTLRLDCVGYAMSKTTLPEYLGDGCQLALGLGPAPPSCNRNFFWSAKARQSATLSDCSLCSGADSKMLELGLSCGAGQNPIPVVDEGSTSAKRSAGGHIPSLLFAMDNTQTETYDMLFHEDPSESCSQSNTHHPKKCKFKGCSKGARGTSGLCIAHGGGQRCQKTGCCKGAESRTVFCKVHGGGKRCQKLGCTKSADSKTEFCIAHGGGRRCCIPECTKAARGQSGLCIKHGGGKRCIADGCNRSAEGQAGLCISHGGGRRCQYAQCSKGAQGNTLYCKAHGGGKRCVFGGCTKGAEGSTPLCKGHGGGKRCLFDGGGACPKSVHGGTDYCVAHGGGKRCAVSGCTRSARGRTDCCVRHGGGKRCRSEGCGKSAQGSTNFCKAHGGGKRCIWHQACEKFARGRSGLCTAHSNMAAAASEDGGLIPAGLFQGVAPMSSAIGSSTDNTDNDNSASEMSTILDSMEIPGRRRRRKQQQMPPEVLVPLSTKTAASSTAGGERGRHNERRRFGAVIPEGRVHGGGLMSLLGGSFKNAC